jgi:hypothetical protein
MGKGAHVSIHNFTHEDIQVSYENLNLVFQGGEEGSDFGPISGHLPGRGHLPASGDKQYIEAKHAMFRTTTVDMILRDPSGSVRFEFEQNGPWRVKHAVRDSGGIRYSATVDENGAQYRIVIKAVYKADWSSRTWMGDLAHIIGKRTLFEIAIPGTHDSATHRISLHNKIAPGQDLPEYINQIRSVTQYAVFLTDVVAGDVLAGWAKAQRKSIYDQLCDGIRYFDLRVAYMDGELVIAHGMVSCTMDEVLDDIKRFTDEHPREIVLMEMSHFGGMTDDAHATLAQKVYHAFGGKLIPNDLNMNVDSTPSEGRTTVEMVWKLGYQVMVFYENDTVVKDSNKRLWPIGKRNSHWPNVNLVDFGTLYNKMRHGLTQSRGKDHLFITQGLITPAGALIAAGVAKSVTDLAVIGSIMNWVMPSLDTPKDLFHLARQVNPTVCRWLVEWAEEGIGQNVVIADLYDWDGNRFVETVVNLNLMQ